MFSFINCCSEIRFLKIIVFQAEIERENSTATYLSKLSQGLQKRLRLHGHDTEEDVGLAIFANIKKQRDEKNSLA